MTTTSPARGTLGRWRRLVVAAVALVLALPLPAGAQVEEPRGNGRGPGPTMPRNTPTTSPSPTTTSTPTTSTPTTSPPTTSPPTTSPPTTSPPTTSPPATSAPTTSPPAPRAPRDPAPPPAPSGPSGPLGPAPAVRPPRIAPPPPQPQFSVGPPVVRARPAPRPSAVRRAIAPRTAPEGFPQTAPEPAPAADNCSVERAVVGDSPESATDGRNRLEAFSPFRVVNHPCPRNPEVRTLQLDTDGIKLTEGGRLVRRIAFPSGGAVVPFEAIAQAVSDPAWINEVEPGIFEVGAAFVQDVGTTVSVAAPRVTYIRLLDREGVFFGGQGANVRFDGVLVTSWDPERGAPDQEPEDGRPFVLYQDGSRLDIAGSEMSYLGSDRGSAYGVTWRLASSTGEVVGSTFAHNFFGVYTYEAANIVFRENVFRDNILYGFDPHDATTGLVVEDNEAYGNGSHGLIVSRFVVDSLFRGNHAHDNRGNGIVMDFRSDRNRIESNLVENNDKDGIVLLGSAENVVVGNTVRGNRVGIRVNNLDSVGNTISKNRIEGNNIGVQAYGGASDLEITDNSVVNSADTALILDAPRTVVRGDDVRGAVRGVDVRTTALLSGVRISGVDQGVTVASTGIAQLDQVEIDARLQSLRVERGGLVTGVDSSTLFPRPSDLASSKKDAWLPFVGVTAVLVAVMLELVRWKRERRDLPCPVPAEVWNRA